MRAELYIDAAEAFAESGLDGAAWPHALGVLASATRSSGGELIGIGPKGLSFYVAEDVPREGYDEFEAVGGYSPHVNHRIAAAQRVAPLQVVGDREYDEMAPLLRKHAAYMDVVRKYDIAQHGCQTTLVLEPDLIVGLTAHRRHSEGRIDADGTAAFTALAPFALAAVRTRLALGERSVRDMTTALEHADVAAFLCDRDGVVCAMTGRGEQLALEARLVTVRGWRLGAALPADQRALDRAVAGALTSAVRVETVLIGPEGGRALVHVRALADADWGLPFRARYMVIVGQGPRKPSAEVLRLAFGLTPAEAEIALALAAGQPREAVAANRGVSLGTLPAGEDHLRQGGGKPRGRADPGGARAGVGRAHIPPGRCGGPWGCGQMVLGHKQPHQLRLTVHVGHTWGLSHEFEASRALNGGCPDRGCGDLGARWGSRIVLRLRRQ